LAPAHFNGKKRVVQTGRNTTKGGSMRSGRPWRIAGAAREMNIDKRAGSSAAISGSLAAGKVRRFSPEIDNMQLYCTQSAAQFPQ